MTNAQVIGQCVYCHSELYSSGPIAPTPHLAHVACEVDARRQMRATFSAESEQFIRDMHGPGCWDWISTLRAIVDLPETFERDYQTSMLEMHR